MLYNHIFTREPVGGLTGATYRSGYGTGLRRYGALLAVSLLALALAACGDDDGGGDSTVDAAAPDATPAVDAPAADAAQPDAAEPDASPIDAGDVAGGFDYEIHLVGSFNSFTPADDNKFADNSDNTYSFTINLTAETHSFKIADASFSDDKTWSASADSVVDIPLDTPTTLVIAIGFGNDASVTIAEAGDYDFTVDASDNTAPVLTISKTSALR